MKAKKKINAVRATLDKVNQTMLKAIVVDLYLRAVNNMGCPQKAEYLNFVFHLVDEGNRPMARLGLGLKVPVTIRPRVNETSAVIKGKKEFPTFMELDHFRGLLPYKVKKINQEGVWREQVRNECLIWVWMNLE
jgi:hypothetical protein